MFKTWPLKSCCSSSCCGRSGCGWCSLNARGVWGVHGPGPHQHAQNDRQAAFRVEELHSPLLPHPHYQYEQYFRPSQTAQRHFWHQNFNQRLYYQGRQFGVHESSWMQLVLAGRFYQTIQCCRYVSSRCHAEWSYNSYSDRLSLKGDFMRLQRWWVYSIISSESFSYKIENTLFREIFTHFRYSTGA